jgi:hypothetical protein
MTSQTGMSFITTFTRMMPMERGPDRRMNRCVGYFADESVAIEAVKANAGDINEAGCYPLCLVETLGEGIYPDTLNKVWFEWNETTEGYQEAAQPPKDLERMVGLSLG